MPRTRPARTSAPVENSIYRGFMSRVLRAYGRRVGAGDIAALPELVSLQADVDEAIISAIRSLRGPEHQYSWQQVADALGISRELAIYRYAKKVGPGARKAGGQIAALR